MFTNIAGILLAFSQELIIVPTRVLIGEVLDGSLGYRVPYKSNVKGFWIS